MMMRRRALDRAIELKEREAVRKRNVTDYFLDFSKHHRVWLKELAVRYKRMGEFPMLPLLILPSYYDDVRDKEVAAFVALLMKEDGEYADIQAMRCLLGDSPWQWFKEREFVSLSVGDTQRERTGGVVNWKIAKLMSRLWEELESMCGAVVDDGLFAIVGGIARLSRCTCFDALTYLVTDCGVGNYFYKLRLLLMVLGTSDGFGVGVWDVEQQSLGCPLADGLRRFIETWFPDYRRVGNMDDAIRLFGFEEECDFLYAYLGYRELQRSNPTGCSLYATRYHSWYSIDSRRKRYRWEEIQPEIPF